MIKKTLLILTSAIALLANASAYTDVTLVGGNFTSGPFAGQSVATFKVGNAETTLDDWNAGIANETALGFDIATPTAGGALFPVENVSWYDAVKWCNLASINDAKTPVYQTSSIPVLSITRNSTTATAVTTNAHGLSTGNHVTIAGASPAGYNLTAAITVVTPSTFTYTVNGSLAAASGTITAGVIYKTGELIPTVNASANGYRLPTEKEWQWAAIGGVNQDTFIYSGNNTASVVAWSRTNSPNGAKAVRTKLQNTQNIYDLSGNVFEWCFDDLAGVVGRRVRGGGWVVDEDSCQISIRGYSSPSRQEAGFGFRVFTNN